MNKELTKRAHRLVLADYEWLDLQSQGDRLWREVSVAASIAACRALCTIIADMPEAHRQAAIAKYRFQATFSQASAEDQEEATRLIGVAK